MLFKKMMIVAWIDLFRFLIRSQENSISCLNVSFVLQKYYLINYQKEK